MLLKGGGGVFWGKDISGSKIGTYMHINNCYFIILVGCKIVVLEEPLFFYQLLLLPTQTRNKL